ncbi:MAG: hypothetical protein ABR985_09440 [Methanotrichaceae archaeon]|jgi:hypothetical protein
MFSKFWDPLFESVSNEWSARILSPVFVFWAGGLLAYALFQKKVDYLIYIFQNLNSEQGLALAVIGLLALVASNGLMEWLQLPLLRLVEGYWPSFLDPINSSLVRRVREKVESERKRWEALARSYGNLCQDQIKEYAQLEGDLIMYPEKSHLLLPTKLGNILSAAEEYPEIRYGLETVTTWPRLWLVLPTSTKDELQVTRDSLNEKTRLLGWSLLFFTWSIWSWWAAFLSILGAITIYYLGILPAAAIYADLIRSAFDLHRFDLYESLRLPLPPSPYNEKLYGQGITQYLRRGELIEDNVSFKHDN